VEDGFRAPSLLFDQMPQSGSVQTGQYRYFKYRVVTDPIGPRSKAQALDIKFTLTPTGLFA
jgi:hypothetical protein